MIQNYPQINLFLALTLIFFIHQLIKFKFCVNQKYNLK